MILAYVGGYDPAYPRNAVLRAGLARLGVDVHALFVGRRMGTAARAAAIVSQVHRLDPSPDVVLVAEFCHQDVPAAWLAARRARAVLAADPFVSRVDTGTGGDGGRPVFGADPRWQDDARWREFPLFYEYFHGDSGAGLGASHQTGWTALVANLLYERSH